MDSAQVMPINILSMEATASDSDTEIQFLVREHSPLIFKIAYSVLRNRQDAEDVAQEVFVRVLKQQKRLREISDVKSWIARIAWRLAVERKPGKGQISLDEAASAVFALKVAGKDAEEIATSNEMSALLARMIASLPREFREAITLSVIQEMSSAEVAKILQIPEPTVRTRTFRARQLLREKLEKLDDTYEG